MSDALLVMISKRSVNERRLVEVVRVVSVRVDSEDEELVKIWRLTCRGK